MSRCPSQPGTREEGREGKEGEGEGGGGVKKTLVIEYVSRLKMAIASTLQQSNSVPYSGKYLQDKNFVVGLPRKKQ